MEGIMSDKKSAILRAAKGLTENYASEELFMPKSGRRLPNRSVIIDIVRDLKSIVFPGYFSTDTSATVFPEYYVGHRLNDLYDRLKNQIEIALLYHGEEPEEAAAHADRTACGFFEQLPEIQRLLLPVYPAEPVVIPVTYMDSLFPQKISFFICEKHRILLSICIEPERCQKRISQKIKHTVLADRHKESCQITVFICVQQCIGEFFRRKISAFYVCIRIHGFIEGLSQPSARLRILQDLFK